VTQLLAKWDHELVAKGEFVIGIYPTPVKSKEKRNKYGLEKVSEKSEKGSEKIR